jgi:hypothetical protein
VCKAPEVVGSEDSDGSNQENDNCEESSVSRAPIRIEEISVSVSKQ